MKPLIEVVANISTAGNKAFFSQWNRQKALIAEAKVLSEDRGLTADRTVITAVGSLQGVFHLVETLYQLSDQLLDVNDYSGNHPTTGAIDVVPFVALSGISPAELATAVEEFADHIASNYGVYICFYGDMCMSPHQKHLSQIRKGGVQLALERINKGELHPDHCPSKYNIRQGISSWTVRPLMLAYNVNLRTSDLEIARVIARDLRKLRQKGHSGLGQVRFLAWYVAEYGLAQISMNSYHIPDCSMIKLYRLVKETALKYNTGVQGSELIGMTPFRGISPECTRQNVDDFVVFLGLNAVKAFDAKQHILELACDLDTVLLS